VNSHPLFEASYVARRTNRWTCLSLDSEKRKRRKVVAQILQLIAVIEFMVRPNSRTFSELLWN
jgi:hypothetical protein